MHPGQGEIFFIQIVQRAQTEARIADKKLNLVYLHLVQTGYVLPPEWEMLLSEALSFSCSNNS